MTSRRKAAQWLLGGGLMAGAAAAARAQSTPVAPVQGGPAASEPPAIEGRSIRVPRLGLALGGGSARGFAHIGVLKSLDQAGIRPEVVVGTSAGALVGAFYAAGFSSWKIEEVALRTREVDLADLAQGSKRGMLVGDSLSRFVSDALRGARIEDLRTRYAAVATDLRSGVDIRIV